ncbi:MAG TPA: transglutaminase-like domain-containing protein [Thermoanaerobaculia bacterium]|jgi:regulator of sirC expression with transglutaminase-like and TPR domain|nr:transglutaminase-like domain-containing protein [Thermoanaerobaculia bacterium]
MAETSSTPRERFAAIACLPDDQIGLAEAALWIAAEEQPGLDPEPWLARLNSMGERLRSRVEDLRDPLDRVERLSGFLSDEVGLRGNAQDYYDPRNSYLNEVLDRGLGIPITLAMIYIEVGRRAGVPLDGVGFPGHFLLRHSHHTQLVIDPFDRGRLLTIDDCKEMLERLSNGSLPFDPRLLRPSTPRQILIRMLNNLRGVYLHRGELLRVIGVLDRVLLLDPDDVGARRDRGLLSLRWGDPARGIEDLERYLALEPEAPDHEAIENVIAEARQRPVH